VRVPLSWLRELVAVEVPTDELALRLSMTGTAVDSVTRLIPGAEGVVVGSVLEVADVPSSDKLCVAQIDAGSAGRFQVVAGAKNFAAGDRVPLAVPGARVRTLDVPVGVRTMMKTYESQGMLCSSSELGLSDDHSGICILDPDAPVGADVVTLLHLDDEVLEFEIYPDRPDQLSVIGIAREVAVLYDTELRFPDSSVVEEGEAAASRTSVTIEDAHGCPRYLARVISDVRTGPAPALAQARLTACGFRPLGNIVDATNYVLLLTGQPLHAFDKDRLAQGRIVVRRARAGERLQTLDDVERTLDESDLVIADATDAQAIAGVMGGAPTEVGPRTVNVLLESAHFDPYSIAVTTQRHGMRTEASARFERGSDPEAVPVAASLCAELIRRWAGGTVAVGAVDAGAAPPRRRLELRRDRAEALLGARVPDADADRFLRALGCEISSDGPVVSVIVPSWRPDLEREVDLIEELARLSTYDAFPLEPVTGLGGGLTSWQIHRRRLRDVLSGAGLSELTLTSFITQDQLVSMGTPPAIEVTNPMTVDQRHLRPSLLPGLLQAARHNVALGVTDVRAFELGTVFLDWPQDADIPTQVERLGVILHGAAGSPGWHSERRPLDAFDAKGILELVCAELGVGGWTLRGCEELPFHPGRSATIQVDGTVIGRFGEVRPSVRTSFELDEPVVLLELDVGGLFERAPRTLTVGSLPTQPPVLRDIALVVDEDVAVGDVDATIRTSGSERLESALLLDVYRGDPVPEGRKSLAFRLTFRSPERTLTAEEADAAREAVADALRRTHRADIR